MEMSRLLVVCLVLMVVAVPTVAANQIIIQSSAPTIEVAEGDPLWKPTTSALASWVNDGINAAAAETSLPVAPGVSQWVWSRPQGLSIGGGGSLHCVIACTPQLVATVAGWEAAWHTDTWERIQADQAGVAAEIARRLKGVFSGRSVLFMVGVQGVAAGGPSGAIWYRGLWRHLSFSGQIPIGTVATAEAPTSGLRPEWAGAYVLGQCGAALAGQATPYLSITRATMQRSSRLLPNERLTSQVGTGGSGARLVFSGDGSGVGFVDLDL